ncbi:MAG TPA: transglutaminase-like cysteine peptidase [Pseudolabrys sp.]|nr:transglutaminase-like cysteine peptidase [Pseudolabrys sp.]
MGAQESRSSAKLGATNNLREPQTAIPLGRVAHLTTLPGGNDARISTLSEPFGARATPPGEISLKWRELQPQIEADLEEAAACHAHAGACSEEVRRFLSLVAVGQRQHGRAQLGWINRAVNLSIRPMSDWAQYGFADVWTSPLQTLRSRAGDCEDYAIVKYAVLRELGFAPDDLRVVILEDAQLHAEHAVVAVREDGNWLILDNRTMAILRPEDTRQYRPLFVLNWETAQPIKTAAVDPVTGR